MQVLIITIVLSIAVAFLGMNRKFGFWGYLFASLLFTPIVGIVLVLASDSKKPLKAPNQPAESATK